MGTGEPAFYFALPRLIARWNGGSAARTESNALETNAVGLFVHGIVCLYAFQLLLGGLPLLARLLLVVPLVFLFWTLFFYFTSIVIRAGFLAGIPRLRAQSVLVVGLTTCLAVVLVRSGTWMKWIGLIWIGAVTLNLCAAAVLAVQSRDG